MSKCTNCESNRIANVLSKASDLSYFTYNKLEKDGYLPYGVGIGGGDYCQFSYCLDCGTIQNDEFPISDEAICDAFEIDEISTPIGDSIEEIVERWATLHADAEKDIEGMPEHEWKEYRQLGRGLVKLDIIPESVIIK